MARPRRKIEFSERMPANQAALYLELIASGLRKGSAYLDPRDLTAVFQMPTEVRLDLELTVRRRRRRGRLEIDLTWTLPGDTSAGETRES